MNEPEGTVPMFQGAYTALITPFKDGKIDIPALQNHVAWQLQQGIHGLVVCGSTGEAMLLSFEEYCLVLETVASVVKGRVPLIAGAGGFSLEQILPMAKKATLLGYNGILTIAPPYIKPSQTAIYQYFKDLHDGTLLPIIVYNHPLRTGTLIQNETLARLSELPRIVGLKDSTDNLSAMINLRSQVNESFRFLSGDDQTITAFVAMGGTGWISVVANIAPKLCTELFDTWCTGNVTRFCEIRDQLQILNKALSLEGNPVAIKAAVSLLGFCEKHPRAPLAVAQAETVIAIENAMKAAGILSDEKGESRYG